MLKTAMMSAVATVALIVAGPALAQETPAPAETMQAMPQEAATAPSVTEVLRADGRFTTLLAGGGVKGGIVEGATDDVGYKAVDRPHYISDLQATILQQMGLNYQKMDFHANGRAFHLIEEGTGPIRAILR